MVPWRVTRSSECPESRPWACINTDSGAVEGCHASEDAAKQQQAALYANEPQARRHLDELEETRSYSLQEFDLTGTKFEGYAAVFDQTTDLGPFSESVNRGSFRKALAQGTNVPLVWNHDLHDIPFASTESGTLKLAEDTRGLHVQAELDTRHHKFQSLQAALERGIVRGMSFGFNVGNGNSKTENRGGKLHRTITGFKRIIDVSPTWNPAYAGTSAEIRNRARWLAGGLNDWELTLLGAYTQLESRSIVESEDPGVGTDTPEPEAPAVEPAPVVPVVPVEPVREIDGEPAPATPVNPDDAEQDKQDDVPAEPVEAPSGADAFDEEAFAARSRRLRAMGLSLPKYTV